MLFLYEYNKNEKPQSNIQFSSENSRQTLFEFANFLADPRLRASSESRQFEIRRSPNKAWKTVAEIAVLDPFGPKKPGQEDLNVIVYLLLLNYNNYFNIAIFNIINY